ncbi:MAG: thioredoxin domain-containing protein [Anaeromyxobacter sp.]|nr:thioredoxin domain-containing protein [Anaeromyxobacter sp.]MBL0275503.1 thioredoxin domain-containing protein [Anaeromyxobacter sp.]
MKQVSWILALVVGIAVGYFARGALVGGGQPARPGAALAAAGAPAAPRPARPQEDPKAVYRIPLDDSPVKGPADALVTVVESSDFECPFCKRVGPTLKQLEQAYPGKLRFAFKHNPLAFHQSALPAALATEEARVQKGDAGFWAMHDALFDSAPALDAAALERAAAQVGLDLPRFRAALAQKTHEPRIRRDQALVTSVGATGTPAFFVNGRKLSGAQPFESFRALVEEELKKAEALVASGTPASRVYAALIEKGAAAPVMVAGAAPAQPAAAPPAPATVYKKVPLRPDDPSRGPADAALTVVVFSDFQCPFCSRVEPTLKELEQAFPGQVRVVWKHQPLGFHPNARPAALAAEAAREQGKFWPMHDKMFAAQQELSPAAYERWAREIGLDLPRFKASVAASRGEPRVAEDQALAQQVGANGTPTMFFNCRQVVGALPIAMMRPVAEEELKKVEALLAKGARRGPALHGLACDANLAAAPAAPAPAAAVEAPAPGAPAKVDLRPDDPVKGNPRAPVTVVVFSDFQCPFCSRVEPTLKQVEAAYGDKVRIAWKHKPLPFHPHALPAAEAAEAAREQGKFWPMHDKMFAAQQELSPAAYERWAREIGLDLPRFKASLASGRNKARIQEDDAQASRLGIDGTPTMVVNGEKVVGAVPFENLKQVIDRQLAAAKR